MGALLWIGVLVVGGYIAYKFIIPSVINAEGSKIATKYKTDPAYKKKVDSSINEIGVELKKNNANYSNRVSY